MADERDEKDEAAPRDGSEPEPAESEATAAKSEGDEPEPGSDEPSSDDETKATSDEDEPSSESGEKSDEDDEPSDDDETKATSDEDEPSSESGEKSDEDDEPSDDDAEAKPDSGTKKKKTESGAKKKTAKKKKKKTESGTKKKNGAGAEKTESDAKEKPSSSTRKSSGAKKKKKKSAKKTAKTREPESSADGATKKSSAGTTKKSSGADDGANRWLCVHCGHRFDDADTPERCPACMRKGGLERLEVEGSGDRPAWVIPALVVAAVAAIGGAYAYWNEETPDAVSGDAPLAPLDLGELRGYLRGSNADGEAAELFEIGDAIEDLAEHATGDGPQAKAEALTAHVRSRAEERAFVRWSLDTPRDTPPRDAEATAEKLADGDEAHLYPLEVAAATVAALREADVPAMLADVWGFPGDRAPPDPSGHLGYFAVAVYDGEPGEGTPTIHDPYGGRETQPDSESFRVLTDTQAVAAAWNVRALHELVHEEDSVRALELAQKALRLDRRSPYVRTVRGAVLIASGGVQEGFDELHTAAQIRDDAPRRNNIAGTLLDSDVERAQREVAAALEQYPDFAAAHATLGAVLLSQGELARARAELETAERLQPQHNLLPMLWAQYHLRDGDAGLAMEKAREAIERRPHDAARRLQAAQIFRAGGDWDEMRRQARRVLEMSPRERRDVLREHITRILGPTALEEPMDELDDPLDEPLGEGGADFALDSPLLGGGGDTAMGGGPSLLDDDLGGDLGLGGGDDEGGPALLLGDPNSLRLREPGTKLRLNL